MGNKNNKENNIQDNTKKSADIAIDKKIEAEAAASVLDEAKKANVVDEKISGAAEHRANETNSEVEIEVDFESFKKQLKAINSKKANELLAELDGVADLKSITSGLPSTDILEAVTDISVGQKNADDFVDKQGKTILGIVNEIIKDKKSINPSKLADLRSGIAAFEMAYNSSAHTDAGISLVSHFEEEVDQAQKAVRLVNYINGATKSSYETGSLTYNPGSEAAAEQEKQANEERGNTRPPFAITKFDRIPKSTRLHHVSVDATKVLCRKAKQGSYSLMLNSLNADDARIFLKKGCAINPYFASLVEMAIGEVGTALNIVEEYALEKIHSKRDFHTTGNLMIRQNEFLRFLKGREEVSRIQDNFRNLQNSDTIVKTNLTIEDICLIYACIISIVLKDSVKWLQVGSTHVLLDFDEKHEQPFDIAEIEKLFFNFLLLDEINLIFNILDEFKINFSKFDNKLFVSEMPKSELEALAAQLALKAVIRLERSKDIAVICWAILVNKAQLSVVQEEILQAVVKHPGFDIIKDIYQFEAYALYQPSNLELTKMEVLTKEKITNIMTSLLRFVTSDLFYVKLMDLDEWADKYSIEAAKDTNGFLDYTMITRSWKRDDQSNPFIVAQKEQGVYAIADCEPGSQVDVNSIAKSFSYLGFENLIDMKDKIFGDLHMKGLFIDSAISINIATENLADFRGGIELDLLAVSKTRKLGQKVAYALPYKLDVYSRAILQHLAAQHTATTYLDGDFGLPEIGTNNSVATAYQLLVASLHQADTNKMELVYEVNLEGVVLFGMALNTSIKSFYTTSSVVALLAFVSNKINGQKFRETGKRSVTENYSVPQFFTTSRLRISNPLMISKRLGDIRKVTGKFYSTRFTINTSLNLLLQTKYKANVALLRDVKALRAQNQALENFKWFLGFNSDAYQSVGLNDKQWQGVRILAFAKHIRSLHESDPVFTRVFVALHDTIYRRLTNIPDFEIIRKESIFEVVLYNTLAILSLYLISDEYDVISPELVEYLATEFDNQELLAISKL